jgi:phosphoribosylanthranilate isomerase
MARTRVKICGITRVQDALAAAHAGADAIGLVFYPASSRAVSIATANLIIRELPPFITRVGLFVDASDNDIRSVLSNVNLDMLQFHGEEGPAACEIYGKSWLKALRMTPGINLSALAMKYKNSAGLLLDSCAPGMAGGTGQVFDWDLVTVGLKKPVVLAGGLHSDNVLEAITRVRPYAVDVSSGVESAPGIKDAGKMAAFITRVREAYSE